MYCITIIITNIITKVLKVTIIKAIVILIIVN